jgi:hypothetical protein
MKPLFYIVICIIIIALASIIAYNGGTKANTKHYSLIDSTNTSLSKQVKILEDSIKTMEAKWDNKKHYSDIENTISTFYEDCLRLEMTKKREGTNSTNYKQEEKKLDTYILAHSDMLRSFSSNGKKIYQIELPSGEVISYQE